MYIESLPPLSHVLRKKYLDGSVSPRTYVRAVQDLIDLFPETFVSHCSVFANRLSRESAERYENNRSLSPLDGFPIAIKDNFDIKGMVTTNGSLTCSKISSQEHSDVVEQLLKKGMIPIGKTTMSELAYSGLGLNTSLGTSSNPYSHTTNNKNYIPGGSSSGSASAVSYNIVPFSIGTDTSGSIRVPAACQGIFGFRPSHGKHSLKGCTPLSLSLDTIGFLAKNTEDCETLSNLLTDGRSFYSPTHSTESLTLIIPDHDIVNRLSPYISDVFRKTIGALHRAGMNIKTKRLNAFDTVSTLFSHCGTLVSHEALATFNHLLDDPLLQDFTRYRLRESTNLKSDHYAVLQDARGNTMQQLKEEIGNSLLIFPTIPIEPPCIKTVNESLASMSKFNAAILRNTMIGSYLDMPSISIPVGVEMSEIPVGIQISSVSGNDDILLKTAHVISKYICWNFGGLR